ncbi:hypothetical protein FXO38_35032 [Capsicum annuum]|nr:hypothetical protein FXO38_35032 [Capsicum annuum]
MNLGNNKNNGKYGNTKGCWTYGGLHLAKSFPNRERVNVILSGNMNQGGGDKVIAALVNLVGLSLIHISLLNVSGESSKLFNPHTALIYVEMKAYGNHMLAMVDTGATHTFLDAKVAVKYGLKLNKSPSFVQTVSFKAQAIVGMAYDVEMVIGSWTVKHNLMVMPLGDFKVIIGIDFFRKFCFVPFSHLDEVMIGNEANPSFIKASYPYGESKKVKNKGPIISAILVEKGLKKGAETFLVAMIEVKPDVMIDVHDCFADLLRQYVDVIPPKLPKEFLPRRDIDHKMELLPGSVAQAQAPHRMAHKDLAELQKKLNELLDTGLIQPSTAPYAFQILKDFIALEPMLKMPYFELPFKLANGIGQTYRISSVLLQSAQIVGNKKSLFELVLGMQPMTPLEVVMMKILSKNRHRGLIPKYDSPFDVIKKVGEVAYRLDLIEGLKIHPTFHVSFLKRYNKDIEHPGRNKNNKAPPLIVKEYKSEMEKILDHRIVGNNKKSTKIEFLIQWKGSSKEDTVWEKAQNL